MGILYPPYLHNVVQSLFLACLLSYPYCKQW
jgi:hypothetical protein